MLCKLNTWRIKVKTEDDFSKICCYADLQLSNLGLDPAYDPRVKTQMLLYVQTVFLDLETLFTLGIPPRSSQAAQFFGSFEVFSAGVSSISLHLLDDLHPHVAVHSPILPHQEHHLCQPPPRQICQACWP